MQAIILAAGLGTRLQPLTHHTPKALILVNDQPLILYALRLLKKHGFDQVLINLHHLGELLKNELGDGRTIGMKIIYSWEQTILGTGGGIKKGAGLLKNESLLVLNSDVLIDLDLKKLVAYHKKKKGIATMVVRSQEENESYTPIYLGKGERIQQIGLPEKKESRFVFTGVQILEPDFLSFLPTGKESCLIRDGYQPALSAGKKIFGYRYDGYWNDLGTFERLRQAEEDLRSGRKQLSYLTIQEVDRAAQRPIRRG